MSKTAQAQCFRYGVIGQWYLRDSQQEIYELAENTRTPFIECCRRFGKTTAILSWVMEKLIANPGWVCRWCEPWQKQARQIVKPIVSAIQQNAQPYDRFKFKTEDTHYYHNNGSLLYLVGVNDDKGESARGPAANIIVCDEYGTWKEAEYIVKSILFPQLEGQEGRHLIKTSTPPPDLGHVYYDEKEVAIRDGRFIQKIIWDKENLTDEEMEEIIKETGGIDSDAFKREYLCQAVANSQMLVIPEWGAKEDELTFSDHERPSYFDCYVGGDSGFDDNTFFLFAYYDFENDTIMVENELIAKNARTKETIQRAKEIEKELWPKQKPYRRVLDGDKQLVYDIVSDHKYSVYRPEKKDRMAAINSLRQEIQAGRFKVHERCVHLKRQLRVGLWRDQKHTDFQRSENLGHLDGIAAAVYLNRSINRKKSPFPVLGAARTKTHFIPANMSRPEAKDPELANLANSFKSFKRR